MIWSTARLLVLALAALSTALAGEWLLPGRRPPPPAPAARLRAAAPAGTEAPDRDTEEWSTAVLARPVFSISRRPPRVAAGGRAEPAAGQARLAGIMITRAGRRAIFAPEGGGKPLVLAEGGAVNQSTIRAILPDQVVLAGGAVLHPTYDRNRPVGATAAFQPAQPVFPQNFVPNGMPNGLPPPAFQPPLLAQPQANFDEGGPTPQPPTFGQPIQPMLRGVPIPPRRE